uniref:Pre-mRNA-splicing factor 18 n=1 Tax=Octactis speculum TaxID=3111310 RepID=A0A6U3R6S4_9STRA|mmetsp:Transcript_19178/g.26012  ORF Transcript_19178/g.26012 Transcript_19178/m.26012 type:complete len:406 (+) Transcript_19178:60-1277(+)
MDALKAEIERKRKRKEELLPHLASDTGPKKFFRRCDLEAAEQRERETKRQDFEKTRALNVRQHDENRRGGAELNEQLLRRKGQSTSRSNLGDPAASAQDNGRDDPPLMDLPIDEVKIRLRDMNQVVTYFGETDAERLARLRKIEVEGVDQENDFAISGGHDTRNVFLDQDSRSNALDDDDDDDDDDDTPKASSKSGKRAPNFTSGMDGKALSTELALIDETPKKKPNKQERVALEEKERAATKEQQVVNDHRLIKDYFKGLTRSWEMDLNARSEQVKRTAQGKIETKTQKQCKDYIRPLFKLCKKKTVPADILFNLKKIMECCQKGEFVMANDAYIQTAIGNSAWPIGITLVGIHQRSAHDGLQVGKVAHVMNNEMQRKYLQSVKRLIAYEQKRRPDVAPSKKVN